MAWMTQRGTSGQPFRDSEGLRQLLVRLQADDGRLWKTDPEATELMQFAAKRYAGLARKHGLDPWEAVSAAYDAMRAPSTLRANDPWAMVTRAVQVTCIAEERAQGLLCSVHQARRTKVSRYHDAERFSDREHALTDYHPALRARPGEMQIDEDPLVQVSTAVEDAILLFTMLDWPRDVARTCVEYICSRLADAPSRPSAHESLRRDYAARALLDIPQASWTAMLRTLLGSANPDLAHTAAGRGVLLRLLLGEPLRHLFRDSDLVADIIATAPRVRV